MYLINDDSINAFVAGGQNIFINTGLILKAKEADALIGVLAHEIGHIAGGHLNRTVNSINDAIKQVMNKNSVGMGKVGQPFRVAMTGSAHAPAIDKIALLLGKDKVLIRLKKSINLFS